MIPKTNQQITIIKSAFLQNYSLKSRPFKNLVFRPEQPKYLQNVGVATRPYNQIFEVPSQSQHEHNANHMLKSVVSLKSINLIRPSDLSLLHHQVFTNMLCVPQSNVSCF